MKKNQIYLLIIISILSIAFIYSFKTDFPHELASGSIGAILTVIVTMFLLEKQTGSEELKEKNTKKFEKKIEVYDEFLISLSEIIGEKTIERKEVNKLLLGLTRIELHTLGINTKKISDELKIIIALLDANENNDEDSILEAKLSNSLFIIAGVFKEELHGEELGKTELIALNSNIKDIIKESEKTKGSKITFNDFDKYKEGQKLRGTTDVVLELIKFIDADIRKSFPDAKLRMSNTHYAFFIGEPGRGNRFFGVSPEKNKLRISFPKEIAEKYSVKWILRNSWPDLLSTYITTKEEYLNQIKEIVEENYKNILNKEK